MKRILLVCLLSAGLFTGCSSLLARTSRATQSPDNVETMPQRGLQVTQVFPGSTAEDVDLHPMDVIFEIWRV